MTILSMNNHGEDTMEVLNKRIDQEKTKVETKENVNNDDDHDDQHKGLIMSRRTALFSSATAVVAISVGANTPSTISNALSVETPPSAGIGSALQLPSILSANERGKASPPITATTPSSSSLSPLTTIQETISGFVSGATITTAKTFVKYPLDTATVRLQMKSSSYKNIQDIRDIYNLFRGSYNGITIPLISNIPAGALFFAVKDGTKSFLKTNSKEYGVAIPKWVSTCIAVAAALPPYWLLRNPSEVIKTRQQIGNMKGYDTSTSLSNKRFSISTASTMAKSTDTACGDAVSAWEAVQIVLKDNNNNTIDGVKELYTGYLENILYAYPADVIKFVAYEMLSSSSGADKGRITPLEGGLYGAGATAIAQFITTPLDVVRNRVMAESKQSSTSDGDADGSGSNTVSNDRIDTAALNTTAQKSYVHTLVTLGKEEGLSGLFAGVTPRIGKAILSGAIQFATYEETKESFRRAFQKR